MKPKKGSRHFGRYGRNENLKRFCAQRLPGRTAIFWDIPFEVNLAFQIQTIKKDIRDLIAITKANDSEVAEEAVDYNAMTKSERQEAIKKLQKQMHEAAELLDFELAAQIRDMVLELRSMD